MVELTPQTMKELMPKFYDLMKRIRELSEDLNFLVRDQNFDFHSQLHRKAWELFKDHFEKPSYNFFKIDKNNSVSNNDSDLNRVKKFIVNNLKYLELKKINLIEYMPEFSKLYIDTISIVLNDNADEKVSEILNSSGNDITHNFIQSIMATSSFVDVIERSINTTDIDDVIRYFSTGWAHFKSNIELSLKIISSLKIDLSEIPKEVINKLIGAFNEKKLVEIMKFMILNFDTIKKEFINVIDRWDKKTLVMCAKKFFIDTYNGIGENIKEIAKKLLSNELKLEVEYIIDKIKILIKSVITPEIAQIDQDQISILNSCFNNDLIGKLNIYSFVYENTDEIKSDPKIEFIKAVIPKINVLKVAIDNVFLEDSVKDTIAELFKLIPEQKREYPELPPDFEDAFEYQ